MRNDKKSCQSEEVDRENLKVTVKIFVSAPKKEILQEALDNGNGQCKNEKKFFISNVKMCQGFSNATIINLHN